MPVNLETHAAKCSRAAWVKVLGGSIACKLGFIEGGGGGGGGLGISLQRKVPPPPSQDKIYKANITLVINTN